MFVWWVPGPLSKGLPSGAWAGSPQEALLDCLALPADSPLVPMLAVHGACLSLPLSLQLCGSTCVPSLLAAGVCILTCFALTQALSAQG